MQENWYENQDHPIVKLLRDNYPNVRDDESIRILNSRIWIDQCNNMYVVYEYCQRWDAKHKYNNQLALRIYKNGYGISEKFPSLDWCTELYSPDRIMNGDVIETPEKILNDKHRKFMKQIVICDVDEKCQDTKAEFSIVGSGIADYIRKHYIPNNIEVDRPVWVDGIKRHSEVRYFVDEEYLYVDSNINFWKSFGGKGRNWQLDDFKKLFNSNYEWIMCKCELSKIKRIGE